MEPELIVDYQNWTGEGPQWHPMEGALYWVDIPQGRLFRYFPASVKHELFFEAGEMLGGYTIQEDGSFLLFLEKGKIGHLKYGRMRVVVPSLSGEENHRFNDVIADPAGRVFCGTMPINPEDGLSGKDVGRLYRLDIDGTVTKLLDGIGISNGMGFTLDRKQMYYTDSTPYRIYLFDYDQATGELINQHVFLQSRKEDGLPDGMTVDSEGYIWSARVFTGEVHRYSPAGERVLSVKFPCDMVSSVTFGGNDMDTLYVTTIGGDDRAAHGPGAGALFRLRPGVTGVPEFFSKVAV